MTLSRRNVNQMYGKRKLSKNFSVIFKSRSLPASCPCTFLLSPLGGAHTSEHSGDASRIVSGLPGLHSKSQL